VNVNMHSHILPCASNSHSVYLPITLMDCVVWKWLSL